MHSQSIHKINSRNFNINSPDHLKAFKFRESKGYWPSGYFENFNKRDWNTSSFRMNLIKKMADRYIDIITKMN